VGLSVADLSVDGRSPVQEPTAEELGLAPDAELSTDVDGGEAQAEAEAEGGERPSDPHRCRSPVSWRAEWIAPSVARPLVSEWCCAAAVWHARGA
jgi:hypothetical protein